MLKLTSLEKKQEPLIELGGVQASDSKRPLCVSTPHNAIRKIMKLSLLTYRFN